MVLCDFFELFKVLILSFLCLVCLFEFEEFVIKLEVFFFEYLYLNEFL